MDKKMDVISYALVIMASACFVSGLAILSNKGGD